MRYSTGKELYEELLKRFSFVVNEHGLLSRNIEIHAAVLTPEEAIGTPGRTDYPILEGKDQMLQAVYDGSKGQVFTDSPAAFTGNVSDLLEMDIVNDRHARSLFIAGMNAVMRSLGLVTGTVHCRNDGMEQCAGTFAQRLEQQYGRCKICQIGYQPALVAALSGIFSLRVLDLNPQNIDVNRNGVTIENGEDFVSAVQWADIVLCTGSTLANGTIVPFLNLNKDVIFYGTTIAGAAALLGLRRMCFNSL
jgi:uncharacterized protein (DUF4213/DUF364 family)